MSIVLDKNTLLTLRPELRDEQKKRNLETLYLNRNKIREIKKEVFSGLVSLKWLVLNNNVIEEIEGGLFSELKNLETLDLGKNKIKKIW